VTRARRTRTDAAAGRRRASVTSADENGLPHAPTSGSSDPYLLPTRYSVGRGCALAQPLSACGHEQEAPHHY
jgi:hypothetical protein